MADEHFIYALCDPDTGEVRYIGRTDKPGTRLYQHMRGGFGDRRNQWINELKRKGKEPRFVTLKTCNEEDVIYWENRIFLDYLRRGARLTNSQGTNLGGKYNQVKIRRDQARQVSALAEQRGITYSMMVRLLLDIALLDAQAWDDDKGVCFDLSKVDCLDKFLDK